MSFCIKLLFVPKVGLKFVFAGGIEDLGHNPEDAIAEPSLRTSQMGRDPVFVYDILVIFALPLQRLRGLPERAAVNDLPDRQLRLLIAAKMRGNISLAIACFGSARSH
jgi:hypothetical protein